MPNKGYIFTEEHKTNLRLSAKSRPHLPRTEEAKKNISLGKTGIKLSEKHKKNISLAKKGKPTGRGFWKGKKLSEIHRLRIVKAKKGKKPWNYKGISTINERIRKSFEYKLWRESVFKRDKYTCVWCGDDRGGNLNADHIQPFSTHPELRFAIDNGRTLCKPCHIKRHKKDN